MNEVKTERIKKYPSSFSASIDKLVTYQFYQNLVKLPFVDKLRLFGSRARLDHTERSDIDIAVDCPDATPSDWLKVIEIIENADTLLNIDCIRFDNLDDASPLKSSIVSDGIVLYEKQKGRKYDKQ